MKSLNRQLDLKSGDRQTDRMNDRMTTKVLKTRPRVGAASPKRGGGGLVINFVQIETLTIRDLWLTLWFNKFEPLDL